MAHEVVVYRDGHAIILDEDFAVLREMLSTEAKQAGHEGLAAFIEGWSHHGPGVWTDEDFDAFFDGNPIRERECVSVLGAARELLGLLPSSTVTARRLASIDKLRALFPVLRGDIPSTAALEVIWAPGRRSRAEIFRRVDGLFQVFLSREVWREREVWEEESYQPPAEWSPVGREALLADTHERARALADEALRQTGG